ncbi:hypothetical protein [Arenicella xantha]|uniref:Dolichyl-phosphate-mannose-protein mannosyltransferase n=1 Tax=Arenicella xantha TaxID=644221 RepID=A0A395JM79_9GAMM|nr:hypothetical protein [Arenicella xantha]RBP48890.1 hypothetical protein DFR28_105229 [Arenicella xantha]
MYQLYRDRPLLVLFMVLANIALSAWCVYLDPVINNDGITYLAIAKLMLNGEWSHAFDYYSWPYYSAFIAGLAKTFHLGIESAAYLLNTLLITSLTLAFVCIVGELSHNNRRVIIIAMVVILFFPSITKYRSFIIRDFGYLSCYLWSLFFIFRFCSTLNKGHLIGWLAFAGLSCLFRFEGIAFLLIAPYFLLLFSTERVPHRRVLLWVLSVVIVSLCGVLMTWYVNDKYAAMIEVAQNSGKDIHNVLDLFLANTKNQLGGEQLTLANYAGVFAANVGIVGYELVRRMAVFFFIFAVYAYWKNIGFNNRFVKRIWIVYVATNFLVLVCFSVYNNFLVSRYTMATALTLLILAPFVIDRLIGSFSTTSLAKRAAVVLVLGLLAAVSLEGLNVSTKKIHIKEAAAWLKTEFPNDDSYFSNDRLMVYYAKDDVMANMMTNYSNVHLRALMDSNQLRQYKYVALSVNPKSKLEDDFRQTLAYQYGRPIKIFKGVEGRAVYIFKTSRD